MEDSDVYMLYSRAEAVAEALMFASGGLVELEDIAIVLKLSHKEAEKVMDKLAERILKRKGGIILRKINSGYQLCSDPALYEEIRDYFDIAATHGLSRAAMETLSVIAYNQPITRAGIELIRGVNSDGVLAKLLERGLVGERGRSENPGRPMLYGTTDEFLRSIGLESLSQLPIIDDSDIENLHFT